MRLLTNRWSLLVAANVIFCCMLSFYQNGNAAPAPRSGEPFANSLSQRNEMIRELKEIKALMREQNALLQSGKVRVSVTQR